MREDDTLAYNIHSDDNGITSRALSAIIIAESALMSMHCTVYNVWSMYIYIDHNCTVYNVWSVCTVYSVH